MLLNEGDHWIHFCVLNPDTAADIFHNQPDLMKLKLADGLIYYVLQYTQLAQSITIMIPTFSAFNC